MRRATMLFITGIACVWLPIQTQAKEVVTFEFGDGKINAEWNGSGPVTVEKRADGILLTTGDGTGMLLTESQLAFLPDTAEIEAETPVPSSMKFIWSYLSDPEELTAYIEVGLHTNGEHNPVLLSRSPDWKSGEKEMGLLIYPRSSILIKKIHFTQWNTFEKVTSFFRSWTQFDRMRPYTINFVWGPQIGWNPLEVQMMFKSVPPIATSVVWLLSIGLTVFFIVLLMSRVFGLSTLRRLLNTRILFVAIGCSWLLLDLYMGAQYLSWVRTDYRTYISQSPEDRTFRDRDNFYDFATKAAELVRDRETYIFMSEVPWPFLGNMRYITYPSIPAFRVGFDDTWVIFDRSEMDVGAADELTFNGEAVTYPGTVLFRPSTHTMVFRGAPLPLQSAQ